MDDGIAVSSSASAITSAAITIMTTRCSGSSGIWQQLQHAQGRHPHEVRAFIPVKTSTGGKLFVSGSCVFLKSALIHSTAASSQALHPLVKVEKGPPINAVSTNNGDSSGNDSDGGGAPIENKPDALRCKRRIDFSSLDLPRPQPASMARRNERERNRVRQVNLGFDTLRQHVPNGRKNKKLSKVETLKEAARYIQQLRELLREADARMEDVSPPSAAGAIATTFCPTPPNSASVKVTTSKMPATSTTTVAVEEFSAFQLTHDSVKTTRMTTDMVVPAQPIEQIAIGSVPSRLVSSEVDLLYSSPNPPRSPTTKKSLQQLRDVNPDFGFGESDGASCPVSPCESFETSEASCEESGSLEDSWHAMSLDIAEWLCSKIVVGEAETCV